MLGHTMIWHTKKKEIPDAAAVQRIGQLRYLLTQTNVKTKITSQKPQGTRGARH